MSDIGSVVFIIGILGTISLGGKVSATFIKDRDIKEIDIILMFIFFMLMIVGITN